MKIDKNVPIPDIKHFGRYSRNAIKYPFDKMDVGDSFACGDISPSRVRSAASHHAINGMDFTVRQMEDGRYRCWRIK